MFTLIRIFCVVLDEEVFVGKGFLVALGSTFSKRLRQKS